MQCSACWKTGGESLNKTATIDSMPAGALADEGNHLPRDNLSPRSVDKRHPHPICHKLAKTLRLPAPRLHVKTPGTHTVIALEYARATIDKLAKGTATSRPQLYDASDLAIPNSKTRMRLRIASNARLK